jgi:release factor glutamine methyltransferase
MRATKVVTAKNLLAEGAAVLGEAGVSEAGLNCSWLLAHLLNKDRLSMLAEADLQVTPQVAGEFKRFLARKAAGEPLAYILGSQPFCGLSLKVDRRVLVPRPETEELVELAIAFILGSRRGGAPHVLDFGAGSGAIALALANRFPASRIVAAEKSRRALACAGQNAQALGLAGRVKFLEISSVKDAGGPFDLIVSNPPYIPTGVIAGLDKEVLAEPRLALDGGADGLALVREIAAQAPAALKKGGALFLEVGDTQGLRALELLDEKNWKERKVVKDVNGRLRFVCAVK